MQTPITWKAVAYLVVIVALLFINGASAIFGWQWLQIFTKPCEYLKGALEQDHIFELMGPMIETVSAKIRQFVKK